MNGGKCCINTETEGVHSLSVPKTTKSIIIDARAKQPPLYHHPSHPSSSMFSLFGALSSMILVMGPELLVLLPFCRPLIPPWPARLGWRDMTLVGRLTRGRYKLVLGSTTSDSTRRNHLLPQVVLVLGDGAIPLPDRPVLADENLLGDLVEQSGRRVSICMTKARGISLTGSRD